MWRWEPELWALLVSYPLVLYQLVVCLTAVCLLVSCLTVVYLLGSYLTVVCQFERCMAQSTTLRYLQKYYRDSSTAIPDRHCRS